MNLAKPPLPSPFLLRPSPCRYRHGLRLTAASNGDNGIPISTGENNTSTNQSQSQPQVPTTKRIKKKLKVKRRRNAREDEEDRILEMASSNIWDRLEKVTEKKQWEEMTTGEKIYEFYVGEKGLLFWLNKFAYASIYVIIGAWILFRFIGPALGLYQLDSPVLTPSKLLG